MVSWSKAMLRFTVIFVALFVCAVPLSSARAGDKEDAIEIMREGDRFLKKQKYDLALAKYREAYEIYNTPKIYYPIAIAQKGMGSYLDAMDTFQQFLLEAPDAREEHRLKAEEQIEDLKTKLGTLTFEVGPDGASISVDDIDRGESPLGESVFVNPGTHRYTVSKPGHETVSVSIDVAAGEERPIEMVLKADGTEGGAKRQSSSTETMRRRVLVGGIISSTALALTASVTGFLAFRKHSTFEDTTQTMATREAARKSGKKLAVTTDILMISTVAVAGFTAYWYWSKVKPNAKEARPVGVSPYATPDGGGVVFTGTF